MFNNSDDIGDDTDDDFGGSDDGSVSLEGDDDDDLFDDDSDLDDEGDVDSEDIDDDSDDGEPKSKKHKTISSKEFQRKLKNTDSKFTNEEKTKINVK